MAMLVLVVLRLVVSYRLRRNGGVHAAIVAFSFSLLVTSSLLVLFPSPTYWNHRVRRKFPLDL
jgi:hypothetical protein